ncbi:hypothetical protein BJ741DRAFT_635833, partial [Chytriomyces cf. hyalinus JEL632]
LLMIDMEEGVINQVMQSPVRTLFEGSQIISSNSGSGNNWSAPSKYDFHLPCHDPNYHFSHHKCNNRAVGYSIYGQEFESQISESLRQQAEQCDNLRSKSRRLAVELEAGLARKWANSSLMNIRAFTGLPRQCAHQRMMVLSRRRITRFCRFGS